MFVGKERFLNESILQSILCHHRDSTAPRTIGDEPSRDIKLAKWQAVLSLKKCKATSVACWFCVSAKPGWALPAVRQSSQQPEDDFTFGPKVAFTIDTCPFGLRALSPPALPWGPKSFCLCVPHVSISGWTPGAYGGCLNGDMSLSQWLVPMYPPTCTAVP